MLASKLLLRSNVAATHTAVRCLSSTASSNSRAALNQFSEEEQMLKESVRKWAEAEVKPHVRRMDAEKKMVSFRPKFCIASFVVLENSQEVGIVDFFVFVGVNA
jgi:hypothetical protein